VSHGTATVGALIGAIDEVAISTAETGDICTG